VYVCLTVPVSVIAEGSRAARHFKREICSIRRGFQGQPYVPSINHGSHGNNSVNLTGLMLAGMKVLAIRKSVMASCS